MQSTGYTAFMSPVNSLWYYTCAKPDSGYTAAVQGYAEKLAAALKLKPVSLHLNDEAYLLGKAASDGPPRIIIGAGERIDWQAHGHAPPEILKARPYQDQHGHGPSMHPKTLVQFSEARAQALALWQEVAQPVLTVCIANPMWLVEQVQHFQQRLEAYCVANRIGSLCMTNSPRTNPLLWQAWREAWGNSSQSIIWNTLPTKENHYLPMLAHADAIMMLGTSRSMASEAMLTGKPIYLLGDDTQQDERFVHDAAELIGVEQAARFQRIDFEQPLSHSMFDPYDVTDIYVQRALHLTGLIKAA